ncbi:helix-turn-helix domain-containing protein [Paenibacillus paridis]|uniref:helix-turn-helix domain-containing protein n=1 Tax=Paenibacillus paridis TaxID=2583376 RepID=UPI00139148F9|nr:helix-turn-helix domain-containing protein [Paenibacillus paridis]
MNFLFDPVKFDGQTFLWSHRARADTAYPGYYHWHQCMELLYIHEGEGSIIVNQHSYEMKRGMLFLFQPFQLHKVFANVSPEKPYTRSMAYLDPAVAAEGMSSFPLRHSLFMKVWQGKAIGPAFQLEQVAKELEDCFMLYDNLYNQGRGQAQEEVVLLILQLMGLIHQEQRKEGERLDVGAKGRALRYSEQIMQWIEEHFAEEVSLDHLADFMHLSKFYVSRVFHEETGSNITDYLTARRIKQASRLLQSTSHSIEQVGILVGYPNVSYFIHMFKKVVGVTPLRYRQRHLGSLK